MRILPRTLSTGSLNVTIIFFSIYSSFSASLVHLDYLAHLQSLAPLSPSLSHARHACRVSLAVYLRFSARAPIGVPTSFVSEWGEEKWRQAKLVARVSSCKPISTKERWQFITEYLDELCEPKIYLDFSSVSE